MLYDIDDCITNKSTSLLYFIHQYNNNRDGLVVVIFSYQHYLMIIYASSSILKLHHRDCYDIAGFLYVTYIYMTES